MHVAMLTPLKDPDHPEPSGDRAMARLLRAALLEAGCSIDVPSRRRMLDRRGDTALMRDLAAAASADADAYVGAVNAGQAKRPDAVFTYHVYYKAPDVAGPRVARALHLPYVVAEGSRAPRRAGGPWAEGHRLAEAALDAADTVLVLNERDREVLAKAAPPDQRLVAFPPFVDAAEWPDLPRPPARPDGPLRLLAVAMMRRGDKLASYAILAEAIAAVPADVTLDIAGDGPARAEVAALFAPFGGRVRFHGLVADRARLARLYADADLLVWPAVNEAFGMVFLEAALQGCPTLAGAAGGVPGVVRHGDTGVLVPDGDAAAFARALAALCDDPAALAGMGAAARRFARQERSLEGAASRLRAVLARDGAGRP
jgi:glycosyltransferase involved in cell wall biosynthesis